jgi:hypothetical protein
MFPGHSRHRAQSLKTSQSLLHRILANPSVVVAEVSAMDRSRFQSVKGKLVQTRLLVGVAIAALGTLAITTTGAQVPVAERPVQAAVGVSSSKTESGRLTPAEMRKRIEASRKLPDDPVAAVKRLLALPPVNQTAASFLGNQTAITATPGNAFAMVRETNCSLTAFNAAFSLEETNPPYTYVSRTYNYDQIIHNAAGLTTTGGQFNGHCKDPGIGTGSNSLIYLGETTSGVRVGALAAYNGKVGNNQLFTIVAQTNGTLVGITTQPDPAISDNFPLYVVSADLNGDGNPDIVSVNVGSTSTGAITSSVTIYLGSADGIFTEGQTYNLGSNIATGGVIDDFNGDGKLDLVVSSNSAPTSGPQTNQVTFLPGNGNGTFGVAVNTQASSTTFLDNITAGLVSGDFNGDGEKDLISGMGLVLLGNGNGTFAPQPNLAFSTIQTNSSSSPQLAVGDFNKDGKLDVAAGSGEAIYVFLGNGKGGFTQGNIYASIDNEGYLTAADLDGDGNLDLYSGDATNGIFGGDDFTYNMGYALMGNGDGTFLGAPVAAAGPIPALEDLNGDGKLDYLATIPDSSQSMPSVQAYLGRGDGSFSTGPVLAVSPFNYSGTSYTFQSIDSYTLIDLNNDGKLDLILLPSGFVNAYPARPGYLVALGNGNGSFQTPTFTPFPSLLVGGGQDYIVDVTGLNSAKTSDGTVELIYSFDTESFTNPVVYYQGVATQLTKGNSTFAAPALTNNYTGPIPSTTAAPPPIANIVDLNGDKTPDLITYIPAAFGSGGVVTPATFQVQLGNTDGTFAAGKNVSVIDNPSAQPLAIADVNGDGHPDLISMGITSAAVGSQGTVEFGVALGNGDGTFKTPLKTLLDSIGGETIAAADFKGDGHVDIALLGYFPPTDSGIFFGNGDGTFQSLPSGNNDGTVIPVQPINIIAAGSALIADINNDGKPDIVGTVTLIDQYGKTVTPPTASTTTVVTADNNPQVAGQEVTFTAAVTSTTAGTPTGAVTFNDSSTLLGTGTLDSSAKATFKTTSLAVGRIRSPRSTAGTPALPAALRQYWRKQSMLLWQTPA